MSARRPDSLFLRAVSALVVFIAVSQHADAAKHWNGGSYNFGVTMTLAESPHYVHGYMTIGSSSSCVIEPGVTVYFDQYAGISAGGKSSLKAQGYSDAPIVLRSSATSPAKGAWSGISISADSGAFSGSALQYVQILNAGTAIAALQIAPGARALMTDVTILDSGSDGVSAQGSSMLTLLRITAEGSVGNGFKFGGGSLSCQGCSSRSNGGAGFLVAGSAVNLIGTIATNNADWAVKLTGGSVASWAGSATGNGGGQKDGLAHSGGPMSGTMPYFSTLPTTFLGAVFVTAGTTLTVPASATIRFASGSYLDVQGKLLTSGTAAAPTTFMGWGATPVAGAWTGVKIRSAMDATSTFAYLKVRHASVGLDVESATRTFSNLTVEDSIEGIKLAAGGRLTCTSCAFSRNTSYAVNVLGNGGATLQTSTFTSNTGYVLGLDPAFGPLSVTSCSYAGNKYGVGYRGGSISADETWQNIGVDWHVLSSGVSIQASGGLTIPAGLTVRLWPNAQISVAGRLTAEGTEAQRVRFTRYPEYASGGNWGQIALNTSATSRLVYADLEYGGVGAASALYVYGGASFVENIRVVAPGGTGMTIQSNSQTYKYVTVAGGSGPAVSVGSGAPTFRYCSILAGTGGGMIANAGAAPIARICYWGAATGPSGSGPGTGGSVSAGVPYEPWLASPFIQAYSTWGTTVTNRSFNSTIGVNTTIAFQTSHVGTWTMRFLDGAGAVVRTITGTARPGSVIWDGKNGSGELLPAGSYLWQLDAVMAGVNVAQQRGYAVFAPSTPLVGTVAASERHFSPNNDAVKDKTKFTASVAFENSTWTLRIKNSAATTVRTLTGNYPGLSYDWDGKSDAGVLQPDGAYTAEVTAVNGAVSAVQSAPVDLDVTAPTTVITAPLENAVASNVYAAGTDVRATIQDPRFSAWTLEAGSGEPPSALYPFAWGAATTTDQQIATWMSGAVAASRWTLRLTATDLAGNKTVVDRHVDKKDFAASQTNPSGALVWEFDPDVSTMPYRSVIPVSLRETIVIRDEAGVVVRTLVNDLQRAAGTYHDSWNGRNDSGVRVKDGAYFFTATVTDGVVTYDIPQPGAAPRSSPTPIRITSTTGSNPFDNDPRTISFSLTQPQKISLQASSANPGVFRDRCSLLTGETICIEERYRPAGSVALQWPDTTSSGTLFTALRALSVQADAFPQNATVVFGSEPRVTNLRIDDPLFSPERGTTLRFDLTLDPGLSATGTVRLIRHETGAAVRTINFVPASGAVAVVLDGRAETGLLLAGGGYTVEVTVVDTIGNEVRRHALAMARY